MKQYKIDWPRVVKTIVRYKLRKPKRLAGLNALVQPIAWLYDRFYKKLLGWVYELSHTSQVVYMEAALNDHFDPGLRRIYLVDGSGIAPVVIYRELEAKQAPYIYQEAEGEQAPYIYTDEELNTITVDFIVMVPVTLSFDMDELIALVDKYRLRGKFYLIQTF